MAILKNKNLIVYKKIFFILGATILFSPIVALIEYILQDYLIKVKLGEIELLLTNISNAKKPVF